MRRFVSPPRKIVLGKLSESCRDNPNFEIYLSGEEAESSFLSLLDELNAYTHELKLVTAALAAVADEKRYSKIRIAWPCVHGEINKFKSEIDKFTAKKLFSIFAPQLRAKN